MIFITEALLIASTLLMMVDAPLAKYSSEFYEMGSNLPPERVRYIGKIMDAAGKEYDRRFAGYSGKIQRKPKLKVYATKDEYVAANKRAGEGSKAHATGGVFMPIDETVYTYDSPQIDEVLRHECFHQFAHFVVGGELDTWVNEGLAEYFEAGKVDPSSGTMRLGQVDARHTQKLAEAKEEGRLMSVDQILQIGGHDWHQNMDSRHAATQYAQAWALCHFLFHGDDGKYQKLFDNYLRLVDKHLDGASAFRRTFGADTKPLQARYDAYVEHLIAAADKAKKGKQGKRKND